LKNPYTLEFIHLCKLRVDDLFLERFCVYSHGTENDKHAIDTCFDLSFTHEDVRKLPIDDLFYGLRVLEQAIMNKSYDIDVIHKYEIDYFAYYYDICFEPIPVFRFLPKEVEEEFFNDVLKKTLIRRLLAPIEED